jgi:predicted nucleotidyltransferase
MIRPIEEHCAEIDALCRKYGVLRLDIFGSAAMGTFNGATSDVDFIATVAVTEKPGYAYRYLGFAEALEALFNRPVDLLTKGSIRNPYFCQTVEATRQRLFDVLQPCQSLHGVPRNRCKGVIGTQQVRPWSCRRGLMQRLKTRLSGGFRPAQ